MALDILVAMESGDPKKRLTEQLICQGQTRL